jgi:hypothetical protein
MSEVVRIGRFIMRQFKINPRHRTALTLANVATFALTSTAVLSSALTGCGAEVEDIDLDSTQQQVAESFDGSCVEINKAVRLGEALRFMDAYTTPDGNVVTRTAQFDGTQLWCFKKFGSEYTIQHRTFSGQYLDAYADAAHDYRAVLRNQQLSGSQPHASQLWTYSPFHLIQKSSQRDLAAYGAAAQDYAVVTRPFQETISHEWSVTAPGPTGPVPAPSPPQ